MTQKLKNVNNLIFAESIELIDTYTKNRSASKKLIEIPVRIFKQLRIFMIIFRLCDSLFLFHSL